jgi:hypothetical protein
LQAADYWLRVRRHLLASDIPRYGYFPHVELQQAPPLVYLVAPALCFHPATDEILRHLSPELEILRVGSEKAGAGACAWSCANNSRPNSAAASRQSGFRKASRLTKYFCRICPTKCKI